jgi:hypothetical protein
MELSVCPSVCLSVCLYVCLSICLSVYLSLADGPTFPYISVHVGCPTCARGKKCHISEVTARFITTQEKRTKRKKAEGRNKTLFPRQCSKSRTTLETKLARAKINPVSKWPPIFLPSSQRSSLKSLWTSYSLLRGLGTSGAHFSIIIYEQKFSNKDFEQSFRTKFSNKVFEQSFRTKFSDKVFE